MEEPVRSLRVAKHVGTKALRRVVVAELPPEQHGAPQLPFDTTTWARHYSLAAYRTRIVRRGERGVARLGMSAQMAALLFGISSWCAEEAYTVPYVPSASSEGHAGLVRIESRSAVSGEVRVVAVDDAGQRAEAGVLTLGAGAAVEIEMSAMESGDAALGLAGTGPGEGDWRLELTTDLDLEARAYARSEGFLTALHDAVLLTGEVELPFFNSGGETGRRSVLRLTNAGGEPATVAVRGVDDAGDSGGPVTVELGAREARSYTAQELESGSAAGLSGSLGDGEGKWRLLLSAEGGSAYATNLLLDASGVLSSVPGGISHGGFHRVSLFPSATDGSGRRGVVRVVNRSAASAEVGIEAFDATDRAYERMRLSLGGYSSAQFDSTDLEQGNAAKGLTGSTGPGEGDWWLELTSGSDIEALSYVDMAAGPLSALRGTAGVETETGMRYEALLWDESGELRLLNAGGEPVSVRLSGTDDAGYSGNDVELTLKPWSARTLTATALTDGETGMVGALGVGTGNWRLDLDSDKELEVLSLVRGPGGKLSDVSRRGRPAGAPPRTEVVDATASGADLWVSASASESEVSPGEAFELRATVGNGGGDDAAATTLRYYRSADAAITTGDTEVGTGALAALAAGDAGNASVSLSAPTGLGTHYYGACVDAVPAETNRSNNCSAAVAVTVREPPAQPDLEVRASPGAGAVRPGAAFELLATVRNRGGAGAPATTLRYYRSADATIARSDIELGTDGVSALRAGGGETESLGLTAPLMPGTYHYGACVDAVQDESDTSNNCSSPVELDVAEALAPDLEVGTPTVDNSSLVTGELFTLSVAVTNAGDGAAAATTLRYYRSADAAITTSDTEMGTAAVEALAASGTSAESTPLVALLTAGTYYYGACADAVEGESDITNNCSPSVRVDVAELAAPDLEVGTPTVGDVSPVCMGTGESNTLSATVMNSGDAMASSATLRYYRSADATITMSDLQVGTDAVEALAASGTSAQAIELAAPSTAGSYYYGACVDAVDEESDTTNNCSSSVRAYVGNEPDLYLPWTGIGETGGFVELFAWVGNRGTACASSTIRFYRLKDSKEEGLVPVGVLVPGATSDILLIRILRPTEPGIYTYRYCVDVVPGEFWTSNNCRAAVLREVK